MLKKMHSSGGNVVCGMGIHRGMGSELQRKIHKGCDASDISRIVPGASYWQVLASYKRSRSLTCYSSSSDKI